MLEPVGVGVAPAGTACERLGANDSSGGAAAGDGAIITGVMRQATAPLDRIAEARK
jgi:hypothetical protein